MKPIRNERLVPQKRVGSSTGASCGASWTLRIVASVLIGVWTLLGAGALLVSPVLAQDATSAEGEIIDPTECLVEPLTDEYLLGLAATPESEAPSTPETAASPVPFTEPEGEPAGEAEVEAATSTVRELVACLNAADFRRVYALYTEEYIAMNFAGESADAVQATPEPDESATQNALVGIRDVIVLEDGRLGAKVDLVGSDTLQVTMYLILENVDDRWLIDEATVLESAAQEDGDQEDGGTPTS